MQIIEQVTEEKDLGILIIINNQLKFHQHVSFATSKAMVTDQEGSSCITLRNISMI